MPFDERNSQLPVLGGSTLCSISSSVGLLGGADCVGAGLNRSGIRRGDDPERAGQRHRISNLPL